MGAVDEQVGDAREHIVALRVAAGGKRAFKLIKQR
jgi:hypothetical protein